MLKKDEVSKYTVPKNALDMLEWPPYSSKYTAKDIPMTDSNIHPPTQTNPIPGTEVTTSPGLIPEITTEYDPGTANVTAAVGDIAGSANTFVENDGTTGTVAPVPPVTDDYAAAVDHQVDSMPSATPEGMPEYDASEDAHTQMMGKDPKYAIATHEHQLNKLSDLIEELCSRVISIEAKLIQLENDRFAHDPNDPIKDYPEVSMHKNR